MVLSTDATATVAVVTPAAVLSYLDEGAVVTLTSALVRERSVLDTETGSTEQGAAQLAAAVMRSFGWSVQITEIAPGRPNVIAVIHGDRPGRTLLLEGHSDVVTEGDPARWSFHPYAGDIVDGRLRGRGSADMKGGVAAMIYAARAVELSGFAGRLVVGVLADEEGMMLGAKQFAASALAREIDGAFVCEPEGGEICPVSKGAIRLRVDVHGAMAHGAMPWMGANPIPRLAQIIAELAEWAERIAAEQGEHPDLGRFWLTPTVLQAGDSDQVNVIPATATALFDVRTIPGLDHDQLLAQISDIVTAGAAADTDRAAAAGAVTATLLVIDNRPPVDLPRDAPLVQALAAAVREVTGAEPVYGGVPGTTDGTILTRDAGIPTVVFGPGGKWIAHTADEYVEVDDLITSARILTVAAARFLELS